MPGPGPDPGLVAELRAVTGLTSTVSDTLDELGIRLAVPAAAINLVGIPTQAAVVIGRVLTIRYLPLRNAPGLGDTSSRLANGVVIEMASPGDVLAISAPPGIPGSVMGGLALAAGRAAGLAGVIVDGHVRDIDELNAIGLPVWAAAVTPITGRGRLEAVEINGPIGVGPAHVIAGDVAVADLSGIAFIPADRFVEVANRILRRA